MPRCSSRKCSCGTRSDVTSYRWCEFALRTSFDIPELPPVDASFRAAAEWRVTLAAGEPVERPEPTWFHHWDFPDGRRWVAFARYRGGYLLRFPSLADFDIAPEARTVTIYPQPATPPHTLRHLLLDQVLPLLAGGRERLSLHGSAVATDRGVLLFLGGSGYGKSTLAAQLARKGLALVSDDCCLLVRSGGSFDVVPSYPGVRLAPESVGQVFGDAGGRYASVAHYTTKLRVDGEQQRDLRFNDRRLPLSRIYVIEPPAGPDAPARVAVQSRSRRAALFDVLNYTFHLDVQDQVRIREAFDLATDVVLRYDVRSLAFPWELSKSAAVAEAVLSDR